MADIPLNENPEDMPAPRPKDEVRFAEVALRPYADGRRVKLSFSLTPFLERPSVEVVVSNPEQLPVASMSLIEAIDTDFDFTLHLRGPQPAGAHTARLTLFYLASDERPDEKQIVDERDVTFTIEPAA